MHVIKTHFHMKGFVLGLALKQRRKATWKFNSKERLPLISYWGLTVKPGIS